MPGRGGALILRREPAGLVAQLIAIAAVAIVAIPLIETHSGELIGAHAPVGFAMIGGAFVFGIAMQIVLGCGSGTLVNAGSGNAVGAVALPFFAIGSFAGAWHLDWWTGLGTAPVVAFGDAFGAYGGLALTLVLLAMVAIIALRGAKPEHRRIPRRLWLAAGFIALLAIANLVIAGQPWGVVYGLGLWAAKGAAALGADLSGSAFWSAPANMERVSQSLLTDVTSLTNIGIIAGAMLVASWRRGFDQPVARLPAMAWVAAIVAGLLLGYSSRLAFGCNVGAFFQRHLDRQPAWLGLVRRRLRRFHPRCEAARAAGFRRRTEAGRPAMKIISSRRPVALAVGLFLLIVFAVDQGVSAPPNPFTAPSILALGSGETAGGAHCAAPAVR